MSEIPLRSGARKLRSGSRHHVAQAMRRVMQLAEYPAKLIARNPISPSALPKKRTVVALQYIYPDEDATLLACSGAKKGKPKVDLGRRVLYGFLARAGWGREEALGRKVEEVEDAVEDGRLPLWVDQDRSDREVSGRKPRRRYNSQRRCGHVSRHSRTHRF